MTSIQVHRAKILAAILACVGLAFCKSHAYAAALTIANTSLSAAQARDGVTVTLGYQITSDSSVEARLAASLVGPASENVKDPEPTGVTVNVIAGTKWYYRDFQINLPPSATTGPTALYDVKYTVNWGTSSTTTITRADILTILAPVPVRVPILMYHKIGPALYSQYWNTTSMLQAQMNALKAYGYTAITCRELMDIRAGLAAAPTKPILLTFDGGYQNFYLDALPILQDADYRAVMFLLTGVMGQDNSWDGDNNPVIMFMTWDEVTAAYNTGYVDLQSHTVTHPDLTRTTSTVRKQELENSRAELRGRYGAPIDFFCYPYGAYNDTVKRAVRDAGYFGAFAAWGGVETTCADKYALKRVPIYWDTVTDYNPSKPGSFFFTEIGDPLPIPAITIDSIQYLDPLSDAPIAGGSVGWGQTVKIRLTATNSKPASDVVAGIVLDTDTDPANGSVFDSHTSAPSMDLTVTGWTGQRTLEWLWMPPVDAPTGPLYISASFHDVYYVLGFHTSAYQQAFSVHSTLVALPGAKSVSDDTPVAIKGCVVSAAFPGVFYIEADSRACGIRVEKSGHGFTAGDRVDVAGMIDTNASGERFIAASYAAAVGTGSVAPLGVANSALGGGPQGLQDGVWGWQRSSGGTQWGRAGGVSNIGLLVRTWGRVKSVDVPSQTLVIDDGAGQDVRCVWMSPATIDPAWTWVTLTGVSSCWRAGDELRPLVLIVSAEGTP